MSSTLHQTIVKKMIKVPYQKSSSHRSKHDIRNSFELQSHVTVYCTTARMEKEEERIKALKENENSKAIISFQAYYQLNQLELMEALPLKIHQDGAVQSH